MTVNLEKRSYQFALDTLGLLRPVRFDNVSSILVRQLIRSSTSVGANIAEARAGSSKKDFINFYHHALKSANETKYWLSLLKDSGCSNQRNTEPLQDEISQISKMLGKSIVTMKARAKP